MVRLKEITTALLPLVGWSSDNSDSSIVLDPELEEPETGLYFQQAHPLLTLKNLISIAPDFSKDDETSFSSWLKSKTEAGITKAILRFCDEKVGNNITKFILESKALFDGTGRISDSLPNSSSLVGFEIVPARAKGITTKINKIGLQFTEPGSYKLYLFHSSQLEPVKVIDIEKTKRGSLEWFPQQDLFLPYMSDGNDAGGSWYLCYNQNELPEGSKAIIKQYDWSKGPCSYCSRRDLEVYKIWSRYLEIHPFKVQAPEGEAELWDIEANTYAYDTNYGINLDISIGCDITDIIIDQKSMFKNVIFFQVAADLLRELAYNANVRVNRNALNAARTEILYELDGDSRSVRRSGLLYQLENAYKSLDINTRGLSRICLPCKNNGIKYRTI